MKISLIIPVYNVEQYLRKCLDSCIQQDIDKSDYEIIVVNDGSPDNCLGIIREYESKYTNIIVINKENGGLSSARNAGMNIASGDYVWFIDSDDWIENNCLSSIIKVLNGGSDIIVLNTIKHQGDTSKLVDRGLETAITGYDVYKKSFIYPYSGAQFYIFKRMFLNQNGIEFKEGIYFEDLLFTPSCLSITTNCLFYPIPVYHYLLRSNSITTSSMSSKKLYDQLTVARGLYEFLTKEKIVYPYVMQDVICKVVNALFKNLLSYKKENRNEITEEMVRLPFWREAVIYTKSIRNIVYYLIINILHKLKFV